MKKHSFKLMLIALIVVICLGTVVLAACNPDTPSGSTDYSKPTGTMLNEIVGKITSSMSFGESFGVDVSAAFAIDDKTAANKDVTYRLTVKGNADGRADAAEDATNFVIDLVEQKGETKNSLLSIAYEAIEDEPFFFVSILGSDYKKINGYSLASLYKMTQKGNATSAAEDDLDIGLVIDAIIPILFGEDGTVKDNVYTLDFDFGKTVAGIVENKNAILTVLGMTSEQLDALVAQYLGNLSYEQNGETINVSDVDTLKAFLQRTYGIKGKIEFKFDANDKFVSANASFDYKNKGEDKANYTLSIEKAEIGTVTTPVDAFKDFAMSSSERKNAQAVNALNFSLKGNATGYNADGEPIHNYTIEVQSDIDAFELIGLLNGTNKENIVATLKKLGYFHLEINEVFEDKEPLNIIMLHSKFEEGFAVVNLNAYKAILYNVGLGGVYDFDTLIDVIGMIGEGGEDENPEESASIIDTLKNVITSVKDVLGYFTFENMKEDGVTVALNDLVYKICDMAGLDTSGLVGSAIGAIVGCDKMNIKLQTPTFGTCETVETSTIKGGIRETSNLNNNKVGEYDLSASRYSLIKSIKSIDGLSVKLLQGESNLARFFKGYVAYDKVILMTGVDLADNEIQTSGFIMAVKGLDVTKPGKQKVTFYIAIANDLLSLNSFFTLDDLLPLSGTIKFETEIEVVPFDKTAEVTVSNLKAEEQTVLAGGKKAFDVIREKTYGADTIMTIAGIGEFKMTDSDVRVIDEDGKDVTADVVNESGYITVAGTYSTKLLFAGYETNCCTIKVEDAIAERVDGKTEQESISLGGTWNFGEYKAYAVAADGTKTESSVAAQYRMGGTTLKSLDEVFDIENGVYTLKKDLSFVGKNFTVRFNNVVTESGLKKTVDVNIPVVSDYSVSTLGSMYFGMSISNKLVLTVGETEFNIVLKDGNWVAVDKDGTTKNVELTFEWDKSKTAVEFSADGFINNYPNENKSGYRSNKINYSLKVDGYYLNASFTAYEMYAINKSSAKVGNKLDGYIEKVDVMEYAVDGESRVLEFKYGPEGYAIYVKGTDTKVYDVTVTVELGGAEVELVDGAFTETGKYKVTYSATINGVEQTFFHDVTVK